MPSSDRDSLRNPDPQASSCGHRLRTLWRKHRFFVVAGSCGFIALVGITLWAVTAEGGGKSGDLLPPLWKAGPDRRMPLKNPKMEELPAFSSSHPMKGFSYGPLPVKQPGPFPSDDMMSQNFRAQWGRDGRDDLGLLASMGGNAVRLYGNNPSLVHGDFLDAAQAAGLRVVAGISDWPYTQSPKPCATKENNFDCYNAVKQLYTENLLNGFADKDRRSYHEALDTLVLVNEP